MLDELGWPLLSQRRQGGSTNSQLILFYKIINGLAQVHFEGVLIEAYNGTRRKHNMNLDRLVIQLASIDMSFFSRTISAWNGLAFAKPPSLAVFRSNFI